MGLFFPFFFRKYFQCYIFTTNRYKGIFTKIDKLILITTREVLRKRMFSRPFGTMAGCEVTEVTKKINYF